MFDRIGMNPCYQMVSFANSASGLRARWGCSRTHNVTVVAQNNCCQLLHPRDFGSLTSVELYQGPHSIKILVLSHRPNSMLWLQLTNVNT